MPLKWKKTPQGPYHAQHARVHYTIYAFPQGHGYALIYGRHRRDFAKLKAAKAEAELLAFPPKVDADFSDEFNAALERGIRARQKLNPRKPRLRQPPKDYKFFLVDARGHVHGGFEYRSDAKDAALDLPPEFGDVKVYALKACKDRGIDLRGYW